MPLAIDMIRDLRPKIEVHYFPSIGSTMTEAARLASSGAPHGTVVLADEQTGGLARLGRSWISEADAGVYCSILLWLSYLSCQFAGCKSAARLKPPQKRYRNRHSSRAICAGRTMCSFSERKIAGILTASGGGLHHRWHWNQCQSDFISSRFAYTGNLSEHRDPLDILHRAKPSIVKLLESDRFLLFRAAEPRAGSDSAAVHRGNRAIP